MGKMFSAADKVSGFTTAKTVLLLEAGTSRAARLWHVIVASTASASQQIQAAIRVGNVLGSPVGDDIAASPHAPGDTSNFAKIKFNLTVEPTSYLVENESNIGATAMPSIGGWQWYAPPGGPLELGAGDFAGVFVETLSSLDLMVLAEWEEIG